MGNSIHNHFPTNPLACCKSKCRCDFIKFGGEIADYAVEFNQNWLHGTIVHSLGRTWSAFFPHSFEYDNQQPCILHTHYPYQLFRLQLKLSMQHSIIPISLQSLSYANGRYSTCGNNSTIEWIRVNGNTAHCRAHILSAIFNTQLNSFASEDHYRR